MKRPLAPHVAKAVQASSSRAAQPSAHQKPALAPHVARAVQATAPPRPAAQPNALRAPALAPHVAKAVGRSTAQPAVAPPRAAAPARPPAPHVQAAIQRKPAVQPSASPQARRPPVAPHVARAQGRTGAVQPYGWALHDSSDMDHSDVVDENLNRAKTRYAHSETTPDPEKEDDPQQPVLVNNEVIHIHAHGHSGAVASFSPKSFARELVRKFQAQALVDRTIVLHSCETGQETYGETLLDELVAEADARGVDLVGTRVFAPVGYLVVNQDGKSYVSKDGVDSSVMRDEQNRGSSLRALGEGWKAWEIFDDGFYRAIRALKANDVKNEIQTILGTQEQARVLTHHQQPEVAIPDWRVHGDSYQSARAHLDWVEAETAPTPYKDLDDGKVGGEFFDIFGKVRV